MGGGGHGIFPSPKASIEGAQSRTYQRGRLEIISSPRTSTEGGARNFPKSQSLLRGGKLGIFPSPKAYIGGGVVIVPKPQEK